MGSPDLKKLVAGFLVLSAFSSALTLIVLNFSNNSETPVAPSPIQAEGQKPPSISANALVESLPSSTPVDQQVISHQSSVISQSDPSNLTQNFANVFAQQVIAHNPDGPQTDANGSTTALNLPTDDYAAQMMAEAAASSNFTVDEKVDLSDLNVLPRYAPQDVKKYFSALTAALADVSSAEQKMNLSDSSSSPAAFAAGQLMFQAAREKLEAMPVPQPLAGIHRSIAGFFANQEKVFRLANDYQTDPLKAVIALRSETEIVDRDLKNVQDEVQNLKAISYGSPEGGGRELSAIEKLLGVRTANAQGAGGSGGEFDSGGGGGGGGAAGGIQVPTIDPVHIRTTIVNWITEFGKWAKKFANDAISWAYTTAVRVAVTALINQFQNQVVNWIAGNGNPKFITNWKGFLADVGDQAIGEAIYNVAPFLCSNLGPLIRIAVLPVPSPYTSVRCTLTQVVQNVQNFYNSFQNGGWIAYGAALQPSNNYFGSLIQTSDIVTRQVAAAQNAAQAQAVASQGFRPNDSGFKKGQDRTCVKSHKETRSDPGGIGDFQVDVCDVYRDNTPGAAIGYSLFGGLNWKIQQFSVAQRLEELVAAVVNAGINRMIKQGLNALTEASNPAEPDLRNFSLPPGVQNPGDISILKADINNLIVQYKQNGTFANFETIADSDSKWLALQPDVAALVNRVGTVCSSTAINGVTFTSSSQSAIAQLNLAAPDVSSELADASRFTYAGVKAQVDNATSGQALSYLITQLQGLDLAKASLDARVAASRLTRLQNLQTSAQANLRYVPGSKPGTSKPLCSTPLSEAVPAAFSVSCSVSPPEILSGGTVAWTAFTTGGYAPYGFSWYDTAGNATSTGTANSWLQSYSVNGTVSGSVAANSADGRTATSTCGTVNVQAASSPSGGG